MPSVHQSTAFVCPRGRCDGASKGDDMRRTRAQTRNRKTELGSARVPYFASARWPRGGPESGDRGLRRRSRLAQARGSAPRPPPLHNSPVLRPRAAWREKAPREGRPGQHRRLSANAAALGAQLVRQNCNVVHANTVSAHGLDWLGSAQPRGEKTRPTDLHSRAGFAGVPHSAESHNKGRASESPTDQCGQGTHVM